MPKDIEIGKSIYADKCKLKEFNITKVNGSLYLSYTQISKLPDSLEVKSCLSLSNCKNLYELPKGLKVKWRLNIENTNITSLPEDLEVEGVIWVSEEMKNKLKVPEHLKNKFVFM